MLQVSQVMRTRALTLLATCATFACGGSTYSSTTLTSASSASSSSSTSACLAMVDALARSAQRCGGDYAGSFNYALDELAGGECESIVRVRDRDELEGACISSLKTISCADLAKGHIDASCRRQLVRTASTTSP